MSKKRVYLIERLLTLAEEEGFYAILKQQDADVLLLIPYRKLEEWGARSWIGLTAEDKKAVNERLLNALNALGHVPVKKETLLGTLVFDGFPAWYYHKFRINFSLQQRLHVLELYRILAKDYEVVTVYSNKVPEVNLVQDLKGLFFVKDDLNTPDSLRSSLSSKTKKSIFPQLKQMMRRFALGAQQSLTPKENRLNHLFVLNHGHVKPILDPDNLPNLTEDNVFTGYFLRQYGHNFQLLDKLLLEKNHTTAEKEPTQESAYYARNLQYNEWIEGTALFNPLILWKVWRFHRHLSKAYRRISRSLKDPLHRLIFHEFRNLHWSSLYFFFIYKTYRSYLRQHKFNSVTVLDEYSPNFRAIVDAAKKEGVRTQAIQHGSLASSNPGYGYSEKDLPLNPWPDRMLVWGSYWKELLLEIASYPEDRVLVTGQIRTDIIPKLMQAPLCAETILGPQTAGKFLILFATQPQPDESLRKRAALDMFSVAKQLPDAWVVVKPHPREQDLRYYQSLAEQVGCTNYSFHYDTDLFLLLRLCQVLVHCYSTVGVEAVYFGMPAIILDYLKQDVLKFAAEGVALQALDKQELMQYLIKIRQGEWLLNKEIAQEYIRKYACAIDGGVSERTAQALLSTAIPSAFLP